MFVAILAGLLASGCAGVPVLEKPTFELAGLRIDRMTLHDPQLGLIVRAYNPNAVSIPLKRLTVALELNERALAEGESSQAVDIPGHDSALVELNVHAHSDVLWTSFKEMLHSPGGTLRYRIHGVATVGSFDLHINFDTPGSIDFDTLLGRKRSDQSHGT